MLLAIAIPALLGMRRDGFEAVSLVNLRSISTTTELYIGAYDVYPYLSPGVSMPVNPRDPSVRLGIGVVWMNARYWPLVMHDVAPWEEHYPTWKSPTRGDVHELPWSPSKGGWTFSTASFPSYEYSNSFVASPAVWSEAGSNAGIGPTPPGGVRYASMKVIFFDADRSYLSSDDDKRGRPVLFADGSASLRRDEEAHTTLNRLRPGEEPRCYHDTPDGIRGRDFAR